MSTCHNSKSPGTCHQEQDHYGTCPKTLPSYLLGFFLSLVLTVLSFSMVFWRPFGKAGLVTTLFVLAILQFVVQVICFLRLNLTVTGRWNSLSLVFAILILLTIVSGSLWIMYNMNANMM